MGAGVDTLRCSPGWIIASGERTVATHRMAEDAPAVLARGEVLDDEFAQFACDAAGHAAMAPPQRFGGVRIEPGRGAEVPGRVGLGDAGVTRTGVAGHQHQTEPGSVLLRAG